MSERKFMQQSERWISYLDAGAFPTDAVRMSLLDASAHGTPSAAKAAVRAVVTLYGRQVWHMSNHWNFVLFGHSYHQTNLGASC